MTSEEFKKQSVETKMEIDRLKKLFQELVDSFNRHTCTNENDQLTVYWAFAKSHSEKKNG